ncbi:hypothetical protein J6590_053435 [Homalodisca vitripennis]|nr:hypothetical protein J6590_053435 [Homalodisca vitripennis]
MHNKTTCTGCSGPLKAPLKSTSLHKPKVVTCHDWRLRTADLNDEGGVWEKSRSSEEEAKDLKSAIAYMLDMGLPA